MAKLTIYQILRKSGLFESKEDLVETLREGSVTVDGKVVKNRNFQCNPNTRKVCVFGKKVSFVPLKYYVINKKRDYSCQKGDRKRFILDLIPREKVGDKVWNSLFCVGRLDVPTTGLLIATNDGDFASKIMEPKFLVEKKYRVLLKQKFDSVQQEKLEAGVKIDLGSKKYVDTRTYETKQLKSEFYKTKGAKIEVLRDHEIIISVCEGKYRQVRKMVEAVGNKAMALERVAIGKLELRKLRPGEFKGYYGEEIKRRVFG